MKNIEKMAKIMKSYKIMQCNGTNKRILTIQQLRKQLDFYNLLKKVSKEISLNYDFQGISSKGFENNSRGFRGEWPP